jgi:AcrR family transcriptional regulator
MRNTKEKILDTSRFLFNKFGYSQVTIRMIAMELKMSSGNLNYHFKKREAILEALYFEMVAVFDERIEQLENQKISLEMIKSDIKTSMERMVSYQFFWTDLYNILMQNDKIKIHFQNAYEKRKEGSHFLFNIMINKNLLKKSSFKNEYDFLIERMISFSNTWLYTSSLYQKQAINEEYIDKQAIILLSMLFPYLTGLGKSDFEKLVLNKDD